MKDELAGVRAALEKWKYPLLILAIGLVLMLIPTGEEKQACPENGPQDALAAILSETQGVGEAHVLISDSGVVVACTGASEAKVRLDIIRAVVSYTGFGSDKITILKLRN